MRRSSAFSERIEPCAVEWFGEILHHRSATGQHVHLGDHSGNNRYAFAGFVSHLFAGLDDATDRSEMNFVHGAINRKLPKGSLRSAQE